MFVDSQSANPDNQRIDIENKDDDKPQPKHSENLLGRKTKHFISSVRSVHSYLIEEIDSEHTLYSNSLQGFTTT